MGSLGPSTAQEIHKGVPRCRDKFPELFDENITAKILRTAIVHLQNNDPPAQFPEIVPQSGSKAGTYKSRIIDFWTCGFFPGSIYALVERLNRYPQSMAWCIRAGTTMAELRQRLEMLARTWSDPIHGESRLTNTHDLGFIMMPHMKRRWEMYHDERALNSIVTSAKNLATRFCPTVGAIRSWDEVIWALVTDGKGQAGCFTVIIDSMCNLDLLFFAAAHTGLAYLAGIATAHARTLLLSHLRPKPNAHREGYFGMLYSTGHVVNFSPLTGEVQEKLTAQGYSPTSTWSRGQAWAIMGYAQTYNWTGVEEFLDTACGLAEYFLLQLEMAPACVEIEVAEAAGSHRPSGRYVPVWDFDAPLDGDSPPIRDTSAGTCAACGMLILAQMLAGQGKHGLSARYLDGALRIIRDTLDYSLSTEKAKLNISTDGEPCGEDEVPGETFEAILKNATVVNNPAASRQIRDHGLVYADYYLIEFGNMLLQMGLA